MLTRVHTFSTKHYSPSTEISGKIRYLHLYVESKIWHKWTYLRNRSRLTDVGTDLWLLGAGGGEGMDWEFGVSRCKLFYIGWINNKVLLYSTGNYIQYPVIKHNGKEYEKECIYICIIWIYESLCCTVEINTTCKLYLNKINFLKMNKIFRALLIFL